MISWGLRPLSIRHPHIPLSFVVLPFPPLLQCRMQQTAPPPPSITLAPPILFADVIVPRHIAKAFTYLVPPCLASQMAVGQCVTVPFGRTTLQGAVVKLSNQPPAGVSVSRLKPIASLVEGAQLSGISPELFAFWQMMSNTTRP